MADSRGGGVGDLGDADVEPVDLQDGDVDGRVAGP